MLKCTALGYCFVCILPGSTLLMMQCGKMMSMALYHNAAQSEVSHREQTVFHFTAEIRRCRYERAGSAEKYEKNQSVLLFPVLITD